MTLDQINEIEEIAALQFSIDETAVIVGCDVSEFETCEAAGKAFMRGRLRAQAEVRKAMLQMARQGSTPAQKEFFKLADESQPDFETDTPKK